jgi:3-hydroxybutyryl-CoA dehydrogenase
VWIDQEAPTLAERARAALAPGVALDEGARPAAGSLAVVTPLGRDVTHALAARGLDARRTVGFDGLFPGQAVRCLFANPGLDEAWREPARAAFARDGANVCFARDSIGLIAQRVLAHVVNVACSMAEQRIASPADIDRAVTLGLGYPHGPLGWGDAVGAATVRRILDGLLDATGDPRYRPSPWLVRRAALGLPLTTTD